MKRINTVLLAVSLALVCLPACAGHKQHRHIKGKVVRAVPIFETVRFPVDEQVCRDEQIWVARGHHRHGRHPVIQTRCEVQRTWRYEQHVAAWDVTYRYHGAVYTTRTLERPGKHVRIRADLAYLQDWP